MYDNVPERAMVCVGEHAALLYASFGGWGCLVSAPLDRARSRRRPHNLPPVMTAATARRPAIILCNGEFFGDAESDAGQTGGEAVAALVDGGAGTMPSPLCSRLSVTACSLGSGGAMAIAKACCRGNLEELCLVDCRIGNAGATALALALGEGATQRCSSKLTLRYGLAMFLLIQLVDRFATAQAHRSDLG